MRSTSKEMDIKRLAELLQEQQEPFRLDVYLLERRHVGKSLRSKSSNGYIRGNSDKKLNRTCSCDVKRTRLQNGSRILRLVINKVISNKTCCTFSRRDIKAQYDGNMARKHQHIALTNQLCSSSSTSLFHSYSEGNSEEHLPLQLNHCNTPQTTFGALKLPGMRNLEAATTKLHWGCMEVSKQISPVPVLEQPPSSEVPNFLIARKEETISTSSPIKTKRATENSIFLASLHQLFIQSSTEKQNHACPAELQDISSGSSECKKAEKVLMQTKQLLFDCLKEAIDNQGMQGTTKSNGEDLGFKELRKIICEQICSSGTQSGEARNITQLINFDFSSTVEGWNHFQQLNRGIGIEIGDGILDDIITEMIKFEIYRD